MENAKVFKYKLDFYYKSLIVYMLFLIVYASIKGAIFNTQFSDLYQDPIIYICLLFVISLFVILIAYTIRAKELIIDDEKIIFKNRFGQREILFSDIIMVRFSRERKHRLNRRSPIGRVLLKLQNRKRYLRIRLSEFWDEKKLISEFKNISRIISAKKSV